MTRRTQFSGSASGRRRERRAHLQSEASVSAEVLHRPTPSRVVLQCKRPAADRVVKAVETETEYHKQIIARAEAYVDHRTKGIKLNSKPKTEYGVMAVGHEKRKSSSKPLAW